MSVDDAVLLSVLRTLLRATADAREPVVLRSRDPAQAIALARWLTQAHGSRRIVIASRDASAGVVVRLPARMVWPEWLETGTGLARSVAAQQFSGMNSHKPDGGIR